MFRNIDVWVRIRDGEGVCIFKCFEDLSTGLFHVQSQDYHWSDDLKKDLSSFQKQALELFAVVPINERSEGHPTLAMAISKFVADFESDEELTELIERHRLQGN